MLGAMLDVMRHFTLSQTLRAARARATCNLPGTWQYWREPFGAAVEVGLVQGLDVALPVHFHQEDQIVVVVSGKRRVVIGDDVIEVLAGEGLTIPAGTPHRSLSDSAAVCCVNLYVPPGTDWGGELYAELRRFWRFSPRVDRADGGLIHIDQWETVRQAARRAGMSREGFTRRFKRLQGLPPEQFRLLNRLNEARRLLRAGEGLATVATATGFSDQSHLGRAFRRFFGVTPGRYRNGSMDRSWSHTF